MYEKEFLILVTFREDCLSQADGAINPTERALQPNIRTGRQGHSKADGRPSRTADRQLRRPADGGTYACQADKRISGQQLSLRRPPIQTCAKIPKDPESWIRKIKYLGS